MFRSGRPPLRRLFICPKCTHNGHIATEYEGVPTKWWGRARGTALVRTSAAIALLFLGPVSPRPPTPKVWARWRLPTVGTVRSHSVALLPPRCFVGAVRGASWSRGKLLVLVQLRLRPSSTHHTHRRPTPVPALEQSATSKMKKRTPTALPERVRQK